MDRVKEEIKQDNYPVFISEGSSESKAKSIQSNKYLSYCLEKFRTNRKESLIIYGQSLNIQDKHLVHIINKHYKSAAISIRPESWSSIKSLVSEKHRIELLLTNVNVVFFDSNTLFDF